MRDQVIAWLKENVSAHRLQHILGVEQLSIELAFCHGVDAQKAAQAGLMHDLAKFFPPHQLLTMAKRQGLTVDPLCQANPHLLHAEVSAIVAQTQFGITDAAVLTAIRHHTLGHPDMTDLSCIVFVADTLEPNRGNTPELEAMRQISRQNLHQAVQQTCDYALNHLIKKHCPIHPRTVLTRNWALKRVLSG